MVEARSCEHRRHWKPQASSLDGRSSTIPELSSPPANLNHPEAPHLASRPDLGPSRAQTGRRGFPKATPQGGQIGTPEPPYEPSTEPRGGGHAHAQCSARSLADRAARCRKLIPAIESALAFGWTPTSWSPIFRVTRAVSEPPGSCLDGSRIYRPRPHAPARPPSRAVANAKTNTRARSPSPCPTAPKQQRSAPDVAHRRDERRITPIHTRRR